MSEFSKVNENEVIVCGLPESMKWPEETNDTWENDGLTFTDIVKQPYTNCVFATGTIEGHPVDTVYLRWERDDGTGGMLMLRPDEMAAIAQLCSGLLWSVLVDELESGKE